MRTHLPILTAALLLVSLTGCSTFDSRARERAGAFNQLDAITQERLRQREIRVGDSFDMVYIALGAPDEKRETVSRDGAETTWIYNRFWQEYRGEYTIGFRRHVFYNPKTKSYFVVHEPVREPVYENRVEERMRVFFKNGQVTAVEQATR